MAENDLLYSPVENSDGEMEVDSFSLRAINIDVESTETIAQLYLLQLKRLAVLVCGSEERIDEVVVKLWSSLKISTFDRMIAESFDFSWVFVFVIVFHLPNERFALHE